MNRWKHYIQHLKIQYSTRQWIGIFTLFALLILSLFTYQTLQNTAVAPMQIDTLKMQQIDREIIQLRAEKLKKIEEQKYFNPNYISEKKAFFINLQPDEWQRLKTYRDKGLFINSVEEFQQITKVSDAWMAQQAKYFKFPDWVKQKEQKQRYTTTPKPSFSTNDINKITAQELQKINGIGEKLAQRIIDERTKCNGFIAMSQVEYIEYLSPNAIKELKKHFKVYPQKIKKININRASIEEIATLPYLNKYSARKVVIERSKRNEPIQPQDIEQIFDLPKGKIQIIKNYIDY